MVPRKKQSAIRLDGWQNLLTALGTVRDPTTSTLFSFAQLDQQTLEALYRGDDMAKTIVETIVDDGMRQGWELTIADIEDPDERQEAVDKIKSAVSDLKWPCALKKALYFERAYGGAAVYLGALDGGDPAMPLQMTSIREVRWVTVFEPRAIRPVAWYDDPLADRYGEPSLFEITPLGGTTTGQNVGVRVHESRLIVLPGRRVTERTRRENNGWGDSVLQLVYTVLQQFNTAYGGAAATLNDFNLTLLKIKGLAQLLASDGPSMVRGRAEALRLGKSISNMIVLDSEEDIEKKTTSLGGLPETLDKFMIRLTAAAGMPATKLFGISPAGMNATGESDMRNWYDKVSSYQENQITPPFERFLKVLFASKAGPTGGREPENWAISWCPLWQPTEQEQAATRKTIAETDEIYYNLGAVTSTEIRNSRFGGDEYSANTEIDDAETELLAMQREGIDDGSTPTTPAPTAS